MYYSYKQGFEVHFDTARELYDFREVCVRWANLEFVDFEKILEDGEPHRFYAGTLQKHDGIPDKNKSYEQYRKWRYAPMSEWGTEEYENIAKGLLPQENSLNSKKRKSE